MKTNIPFILMGAVAAAGFASQPAAAQQTDTIAVSASVTANCIVDAGPIAFGDVDTLSGQAVDGAGVITVTCTNETPWTASADVGVGTGATHAARQMLNGTDLLAYTLYTDSARTTVWGDGVDSTAQLSGTGDGSAQAVDFYGRIAANQTAAPSGAYADTVTVTVSY